LVSVSFAATASAQLRLVNYNIASLNGNMATLQDVFARINADDKPGFAVAPHLYVFQEVQSSDVAPLLNLLNAAAPPGVTYTQGTFTFNTPPNTNENGSAGAQAMFYRADVLTEDIAAHLDISTGAGRNADRWKLWLVGYTSPDASFYIYSAHLKASNTSADANTRLSGATAIRNNADALPAGTHIIYAGDFNIYYNTETAYQKFLSVGNGQALDPLGSGTWLGAANAIKHSQAPCAGSCSLVNGGMDDRFDFQLSTQAFQDGEGIALIPGAYRSFGNDGNHYDQSINTGNNTYYPLDIPRSNAVANDLYSASDHLPVIAEYQRPAVMAASMPADFGRVIQGAVFVVQMSVSNTAIALVSAGADELDFSVAASGALSGTPSGSVPALSAPATVPLAVDTTTVGSISGAADVTSASQAVQNPSLNLTTSGTVIRHANASFSSSQDDDSLTVSQTMQPDTGVQQINVELFNLGFESFQAALDVDAVDGLAAPFALAGPLPTNIGTSGAAIPLSLDTTGLAPCKYTTVFGIHTSDENLPGESSSLQTLTLQVVVLATGADVDADGVEDANDIETFAAVLVELDLDPCHTSNSDFDLSSTVDGGDIAFFLDAYLN